MVPMHHGRGARIAGQFQALAGLEIGVEHDITRDPHHVLAQHDARGRPALQGGRGQGHGIGIGLQAPAPGFGQPLAGQQQRFRR